jgi:hypothetical protein
VSEGHGFLTAVPVTVDVSISTSGRKVEKGMLV